MIRELNRFIPGWLNYFRVGLSKKLIQELNRWIVRQLRVFLWEQWCRSEAETSCLKNSNEPKASGHLPRTKVRNLKKLGLGHDEALKLGNTRKGPWRVSDYRSMNFALPAQWFVKNHGLIRLR